MVIVTEEGRRARDHGSTLIELLAAFTMLSLLLVPITSTVLRLHEHVIDAWRGPLEDTSAVGTAESAYSRLWRWSDVEVASTTSCPDGMEVRLRGGLPGRDREIGWWLDGWPAGHSIVDNTGRALLVFADPASVQGVALTIRAREMGGSWGVPWRFVWEPAPAAVPGVSLAGASSPAAGETGEGGAVAVIHVRIPGQGILDTGDAHLVDSVPGAGNAATLFVPPDGALIRCDGETQSVRSEAGSPTHVFF